MRLLLVSPGGLRAMKYGQPRYYSENMAVYPPLSLLPLVSYLKANTAHQVKVIDMAILDSTLEDLGETIVQFEPDVVGITCVISEWYNVVTILRYVKGQFPGIKTVAGGYNVAEFPAETLAHECIDFIVLGSGQEPLKNLLDSMEAGESEYETIRGVFTRHSRKTNFREENVRVNPDLFPFPDRTCTPYKKYRSAITQRFPSTVMISSEGCPFHCNFCNTALIKQVLIRDPVSVVDEMEQCKTLGINEVMFQDELFTISKSRVLKICQEITDRNLDIAWNFKSRVDLIDEEMLPHLKRAGCTNVHLGVESGNDEILERMGKNITTGQVRTVFRLLKKHKLDGSASFMIAYPGETLEQIRNTIRFAVEIEPAFAQFTITSDFPGTKIYYDNLEAGRYPEDIWKRFVLNPDPGFKPPFSSTSFDEAELNKLLHYAYRKFYFRPAYVKQKLLSLRNLSQFWNQFRIAADMLRGD